MLNQALLGSGYGVSGRKLTSYGGRLYQPKMKWLVQDGVLVMFEGLMVEGCGRILGQVLRFSLDRWSMLWGRVIVSVFGMVLGVSLFLLRISILVYLLALFLRKLGFLNWLFLL